MQMAQTGILRRRDLLFMGAAGFLLSPAARPAVTAKPLRGIFPIAETPFTSSGQMDLESLVEQLRFANRGGVHGFVWPQIASEWQMLTERERLEGAEAIASTGRKLRPAIVIGVQAADTATAVRYAKHAERLGADAIISLPPANPSRPGALKEYYRQIGNATALPLFVQAVSDMSVDSILSLYQSVPTIHYVKDEAGQPLMRVADLRNGSHDELKVFSGGHGRTLIDEMIRGFSGSMPAASFADVYASAWDLWHAGKQREAIQEFGIAAILIQEIGAYPQAMKFILYARGVFKTYLSRHVDPPGRAQSTAELDEASQNVLRQMLDLMKPFMKA